MPLVLQILTPSGEGFEAEGLDEVVFRRREEQETPGSLISVHPRHGSLLCLTAEGGISWRRGQVRNSAAVGPGIIEVCDDRLVLLAPYLRRE